MTVLYVANGLYKTFFWGLGFGVGQILAFAFRIILEADRFEAKLREMFGFSAQVKANMAHIRQSRPDSGINKTVKVRLWHI